MVNQAIAKQLNIYIIIILTILLLLLDKCKQAFTLNLILCPPQHFIYQREEFETARDCILVWLTEMDLQLTNIEHFSECDVQAKIKQLRVRLWPLLLHVFSISPVTFTYGGFLLHPGVPAGDHSEHCQDRPHLPAG